MGGARNGVESLDPLQVAAKIKAYVEMIEQYMFRPKQSKMREASTVASSRWTSQPAGAVCVNVDASLFHHGYLKVVLTSDCLTLVQRLSSQVQDRSHIGTVC
jgi:predicted transcriptional regulator YheO